MEEIEFAQQKHRVWFTNRAVGDLEYKQRKNWESPNDEQRERANLLFNRVEQGVYNLANDILTCNIEKTGVGNDYTYELSDGIGCILFYCVEDSNGEKSIIIKGFTWDYKLNPNSWWSIVESIQKVESDFYNIYNRILQY